MAAIVSKGGRVLSVGVNKNSAPKRFTRPHREGMSLHAEIDALLGLDKAKTRGATLIVVGETVAGNKMATTRPCLTCEKICATMGIKRVLYYDKGILKDERANS